MSRVRRDSQRLTSPRHVTAGATAVIGCEVGAHGTSRRHSFHSSATAPARDTLTAQTGAADVTFIDHAAQNRFVTYYRAIRAHSADNAVVRCPSVARRYCVEVAKHIVKLFFTIEQRHHSCIYVPNLMAVYRRRLMQMKYEKKCDFRPIYRFISETIQ